MEAPGDGLLMDYIFDDRLWSPCDLLLYTVQPESTNAHLSTVATRFGPVNGPFILSYFNLSKIAPSSWRQRPLKLVLTAQTSKVLAMASYSHVYGTSSPNLDLLNSSSLCFCSVPDCIETFSYYISAEISIFDQKCCTPKKAGVILHLHLPGSLQQPLSFVPKVATVETFDCTSYQIISNQIKSRRLHLSTGKTKAKAFTPRNYTWQVGYSMVYTTRKRYVTSFYHTITVDNTINVTYARHIMGRLEVILSNT